ncbi:hypothetical protein G7Y89_g15763 [Cudoniella acicularis]|uniref:Uncharacterized protein n=1 Tax=Cudoniella acicularis TaxID=354080 RepID=A0A8H4QH93_9HELO|nr:hypothetical protein G7Y89_g15763 [Cudoniella acicularis]
MTSQEPTPSSNHEFTIHPPLLNSANPWATTAADLQALYECPFTGAVTIRTSLLEAFNQNPQHHQYTFFSSVLGHATAKIDTTTYAEGRSEILPNETSSLNTLGYSPIPFSSYLAILKSMRDSGVLNTPNRKSNGKTPKPFIVSVTGTAEEVSRMYLSLLSLQNEPETLDRGLSLAMEINLSCPNIPEKVPPAYDASSLSEYIESLSDAKESEEGKIPVHVGIKTPPYTYHGQFVSLVSVLDDQYTRFLSRHYLGALFPSLRLCNWDGYRRHGRRRAPSSRFGECKNDTQPSRCLKTRGREEDQDRRCRRRERRNWVF